MELLSWNEERNFKSFWPAINIRSLVRDVEDHLLRFSLISSLVCEDWLCCVLFLLQRSSEAASVIIWGGWWWGCAGLDELHVIGWEHSKMAVRAVASPPALVYHLDPGDDFVGIEWDLGVVGCRNRAASHQPSYCMMYVYKPNICFIFLMPDLNKS